MTLSQPGIECQRRRRMQDLAATLHNLAVQEELSMATKKKKVPQKKTAKKVPAKKIRRRKVVWRSRVWLDLDQDDPSGLDAAEAAIYRAEDGDAVATLDLQVEDRFVRLGQNQCEKLYGLLKSMRLKLLAMGGGK